MIDFKSLIQDSVLTPKDAAAQLFRLNLSAPEALGALFGAVAASVVMVFAMNGFEAVPLFPGMPAMGPLSVAAIAGVFNVLMVIGVQAAGRVFDGEGTFAQSAIITAWLQILQLFLQIVQLGLSIISVVLEVYFGLFSLIFILWVFSNFIAALHDLSSAWKGLLIFIMAVLAMSFLSFFLLSITGLGHLVIPAEVANGL